MRGKQRQCRWRRRSSHAQPVPDPIPNMSIGLNRLQFERGVGGGDGMFGRRGRIPNGGLQRTRPGLIPVAPLLVVTRTAIGLGLGILIADKIKPAVRQVTAITLLAIGALAAAPWLVKITVGQINRPESEWGSRARLRSIRGDSGYSLDSDIY